MNRSSCPKCGQEVPKAQRYLRNWSWAKWECSKCGTLLGFSQKPRNMMMLLNFLIIALVWIIKIRWDLYLRWWLYGWLVLTALLIVPLIDKIVEVRKQD